MSESNTKFSSVEKIIVQRDGINYVSSCVFIDPYTALTASHSVFNSDKITISDNEAAFYRVHPDYKQSESNYLNDIAIIRFKKPHFSFSNISEDLWGPVFYRVGHGLRDNKNERAAFLIKLLETKSKHNCFLDYTSVIGDSGGGVFNSKFELVGIHSTKEDNKIYTVNLAHYMDWITPYISKSQKVSNHWL